jgi:hypothetical protein
LKGKATAALPAETLGKAALESPSDADGQDKKHRL